MAATPDRTIRKVSLALNRGNAIEISQISSLLSISAKYQDIRNSAAKLARFVQVGN